MGRPTKLTPELQERFVALVRAGNYIETVCNAVGIGSSTFYDWMERAEAGEQPYSDFADAVKSADGMAEMEAVEGILTHAAETWQAFAWFLERRHPKRWRAVSKIEQDVKITDEGPDPDEIAERIRAVLAARLGDVAEVGPGTPALDSPPSEA